MGEGVVPLEACWYITESTPSVASRESSTSTSPNAPKSGLYTVFQSVQPLALLGVLSSLNAWPGNRAAYQIIEHWQLKQSHLLRSEPLMGLAYDESPLFSEAETSQAGHRKSLLFSLRTPWIFLLFWIVLGGYAVFIQLA